MNQSQHEREIPTQPILVIGEYGVLNGGERSFLTVAKHLIACGWSFVAAVPRDSPFEKAMQKIGIRNVGLVTHFDDGVRLSQTELREHIAGLVAEVKPCLMHANSLSMSRIVGPLNKSVPSIGYLRDILKLSKKATADINQNDLIVAVSNATARWHVEQGLNADRVVTIYNGVDAQIFHPLEACDETNVMSFETSKQVNEHLRVEFGFTPEDCVLLYVGQIGMRKGISDLAEIFLRASQQVPNLKLLIVGERHSTKAEAIQYEQDIRHQLAASSFSRSVKWLGRRDDVADLMRLADILLHPARQEPLGRVLLEASASALPIVTNRVGGSSEILNGLLSANNLFTVGDNEQIVQRIVQLSKNGELRQEIGQEQREIAIERFSIDKCKKSLAETYLKALEQCTRQPQTLEQKP